MPSRTSNKFNLVQYLCDRITSAGCMPAPAILFRERWVTFEQIFDRCARFASLLANSGVGFGDRVALLMRDCPEFFYAFLGAIHGGAIAVPINTHLAASDLEFILRDCGAAFAIATGDQHEKMKTIQPRLPAIQRILWLDPEDSSDFLDRLEAQAAAPAFATEPTTPAFILYTSGSTGEPKGAVHVHRSIPYTIETACTEIMKIVPDDLLFSSSRLFFAYGLGNSLSSCLGFGARVVLCSEKPSERVIREIFSRSRPTIFCGVPSIYQSLLQGDQRAALRRDSASLRLCMSAGERLPEKLCTSWWAATGVEVLDAIGSTEMLHIFISNRSGEVVPGSSGRPVPGYRVRLVDDQGETLEGPGRGDLWVAGDSAMSGYWRNETKTRENMAAGWMRTGDVYRRDERGYYWHEGRRDDVFKVKGLWVSPLEIEDVLLSHPRVAEAAVVQGAGPEGLNIAVAFVVLCDDQDPIRCDSLTDHCRSRLPAYKSPAEIRFVRELPRTATGKVQRFKLRSELGEDARPGRVGEGE